MSTIKSYVKQVLAQLTGDQNTVVAQRNYRTALATLKGQIASLEAAQVKLDTALDKAQENLFKAKYPTEEISDGESYLENIQDAQTSLDSYQESLNENKYSIEYFRKLQAEFDKDSE